MPAKYFWLKERFNPQLRRPYYVLLGNIATREAMKSKSSKFGFNDLHKFETETEYQARVTLLRAAGARILGD